MKSLPKIAIHESLDELDVLQAEQVLLYIKGLLNTTPRNRDYYELKRKALKEIRQALDKDESLELQAWRDWFKSKTGVFQYPDKIYSPNKSKRV